ncbi:MAG: hypothetical protein HYT31_03060 [Parcubacteria group bacterium]|nr:hypothetical protein [Parcubacteria group bacterium]
MANEQAQPNKPRMNAYFLYLFIGVFVVLVVSGCSVLNKSANPRQSSQSEAAPGLLNPKETSINEKSTDAFAYSDAGRNFDMSEGNFAVLEAMKPSELAANSAECTIGKDVNESGIEKDKQYFQQLLSAYTENDMGTAYSFAYDGQSQEGDWKVTAIPNKLGYINMDQFKNDFDLCFAGGIRYPLLVSRNYLLFASACGTGFDDGSGLPHGCYEMQQIIEPTIILK